LISFKNIDRGKVPLESSEKEMILGVVVESITFTTFVPRSEAQRYSTESGKMRIVQSEGFIGEVRQTVVDLSRGVGREIMEPA
jgi:hypothetical protein